MLIKIKKSTCNYRKREGGWESVVNTEKVANSVKVTRAHMSGAAARTGDLKKKGKQKYRKIRRHKVLLKQ